MLIGFNNINYPWNNIKEKVIEDYIFSNVCHGQNGFMIIENHTAETHKVTVQFKYSFRIRFILSYHLQNTQQTVF